MKSMLKCLITIVERGQNKKVLKLLKQHGVTLYGCFYGCGTACSEIMDYLGLDEPEKDIVICCADSHDAELIISDVTEQLHLSKRGSGIMFTVPITAVNSATKRMIPTNSSTGEVNNNMKSNPLELVVAVVSRGLSDIVMKSASEAGATGGTVVRSRGIGPDDANEMKKLFFQPEKEIVFIITPLSSRNAIMKAICTTAAQEAGEEIVTYSLPIDAVSGLHDNPVSVGSDVVDEA